MTLQLEGTVLAWTDDVNLWPSVDGQVGYIIVVVYFCILFSPCILSLSYVVVLIIVWVEYSVKDIIVIVERKLIIAVNCNMLRSSISFNSQTAATLTSSATGSSMGRAMDGGGLFEVSSYAFTSMHN